ncbi:LysR family transcriptional regulator [Xylocopilactobacillus apicola]|uniref:Transcriptional regulator n=1 Tax=Xylocopilactobacillus apicola TaxID=2932184 RepID=A0AAU9D2H8_9LACO|nr:LysR family transcriptional regulator [Xylocopilactobacillus apicola]BDR58986.1 transcriptional regulator [Xylocopilactobacillus apicola]
MTNFSYQVFREVVVKGTFTRAAQSLNVTPSAVSHSINQLEKELGFPLLIRNRTGVELTADGKTLMPVVQSILNLEDQLQQVASNINGSNTGTVRIGAFSSVSTNWLPNIIRRFKEKYTNVEINVIQGGFNQIIDQIKQGRVDLGFSSLPVEEGIVVEPLVRDQIYCVTPRDFVPNNQKSITDKDVAKQNFVLQQIDYDRDTKRALDRYRVSSNSISYSIDDPSILAMVESGLGLGILPELALKRMVGDVNIYPFEEPYFRTLCLVMNPITQKSPSVCRMKKTIESYLAEVYGKRYLGE